MITLTKRQSEFLKSYKDGDTLITIGGSGSGKTTANIIYIIHNCLRYPNINCIVLRYRFTDLKLIMSSMFKEMLELGEVSKSCYKFNKAEQSYEFYNGSRILSSSMDATNQSDKLLSNNYSIALCVEVSEFALFDTLSILETRMRQTALPRNQIILEANPTSVASELYHLIYKDKTPDGEPISKYLKENIVVNNVSPVSNKKNLPPAYIKKLESLQGKFRNRFYLGEFSKEDNNAYFLIMILNI